MYFDIIASREINLDIDMIPTLYSSISVFLSRKGALNTPQRDFLVPASNKKPEGRHQNTQDVLA